MAKPIVCAKGKCMNKRGEFLDECIGCDIIEEIEHDLMREQMK